MTSSNSTKAHIAALALLDRAFLAMTDDELTKVLGELPDDHAAAVKRIAGFHDDGEAVADDELIEAIRVAARKGRMNGDLHRLGVVLSDQSLADCIEQLGDAADMPSEEDLQGVIPALIDKHGVGMVRVMLASTVVGEAPASATIVGMLKNDETIKLPPAEPKPVAPLLPPKADDAERLAIKAQRKERKTQEREAARLRREQIARSKHRA